MTTLLILYGLGAAVVTLMFSFVLNVRRNDGSGIRWTHLSIAILAVVIWPLLAIVYCLISLFSWLDAESAKDLEAAKGTESLRRDPITQQLTSYDVDPNGPHKEIFHES